MTTGEPRTLDELTLGDSLTLQELVDSTALSEMAMGFYDLFRVPLRIFSESGQLLGDAAPQPGLHAYLAEFSAGRTALNETVAAVKSADPGADGEAGVSCFTGAQYHVVAISYDGRRLGRMVLGPFLAASLKVLPDALQTVIPEGDDGKAKELLSKMSRARPETVSQIARHLKSTLDLILFSGHKALLTSNMHLASVRESFRELQDKNDKLQEAYDRLKELDRLKSNFLATVSHELRTPLTSIIGYSEMLSEGIAGDMTDEQTEFVRTIHEKGEQLLELISSLLDLSKLESGTLQMRRLEVNIGGVIKDVVATLTPTAIKKNVRLKQEVGDDLPSLSADGPRLRQVLVNLTENAIKFTPANGVVVVSAKATEMDSDGDGGHVLFATMTAAVEMRVADSGIGIPDAEKTKIFDAFYQIDSSSTREAQGTGLGLSIVKRLVDGHGGTVKVEDNQPEGAVIVVTIPRKAATVVD
ncbi:MAG: HAMP domain-containing histidine kinase [Polyangiaceae bacterium]|nr:HAMP domain-containing histidine kinase [Polyangiaceae bacterium]